MAGLFDDAGFPDPVGSNRDAAGRSIKVLFVCSRNRIRSLTAEKLLDGLPGFQVRSVGTQPEARVVVTEGHLRWADVILAMEKSHVARLRQKFPEGIRDREVHALRIPDDYSFMQPELLDELRAKRGEYLPLPRGF